MDANVGAQSHPQATHSLEQDNAGETTSVNSEHLLLKELLAARGEVDRLLSRIPKIPRFGGFSAQAKEFLCDLRHYFDLMGGISDAQKIAIASEYMTQDAYRWYLERVSGKNVKTYKEFEQLLRSRFYTGEMKRDCFRKLRRCHCKGSLLDYVREFSELMSEIDYELSPKSQLMFFTDGLPYEVFIEVEKKHPQKLAEAVEIVKGLRHFNSRNCKRMRGQQIGKSTGNKKR